MNTFSASGSLKAGWELFKKRPGYLAAATLLAVVASRVINAIATGIGGGSHVTTIIIVLLGTFVGMGTVAFALKAFEDPMKADIKDLWHPQHYVNYLFATMIVGICVAAGLVFLIVPGVIVGIMFSMAKFLVIDRNLTALDAVKESMRITEGSRLELFILMLGVIAINILGAIALFFGLLVSLPVSTLALVSAYRTLEQKAGAVTVSA